MITLDIAFSGRKSLKNISFSAAGLLSSMYKNSFAIVINPGNGPRYFGYFSFGKRLCRFFSVVFGDLLAMSAKQSVLYLLLYFTTSVDAAKIIFFKMALQNVRV